MKYKLAQINIGKAKGAMDSAVMKGFVDRLNEINSLADQSSGFVWRLQTEEGDATSIQAFDSPDLIVNLSVWDDVASLKNFVYKTQHVELIRERSSWFDKLDMVYQALWWIPENTIPTVEQGKAKLELIQKKGSTQDAFTFAKPFQAPE